jgi:hypothetical protein
MNSNYSKTFPRPVPTPSLSIFDFVRCVAFVHMFRPDVVFIFRFAVFVPRFEFWGHEVDRKMTASALAALTVPGCRPAR